MKKMILAAALGMVATSGGAVPAATAIGLTPPLTSGYAATMALMPQRSPSQCTPEAINAETNRCIAQRCRTPSTNPAFNTCVGTCAAEASSGC